jgi:hypothetical protein
MTRPILPGGRVTTGLHDREDNRRHGHRLDAARAECTASRTDDARSDRAPEAVNAAPDGPGPASA